MTSVIVTSPRDRSLTPPAAAHQAGRIAWGFPEVFVISQTVLPALLYLPGTQAVRVPIRIGAFALSLAALVWWLAAPRRAVRQHPSRPWLVVVVAYLAFQVVHPTTNTPLAGAAQAMLYLAVMAPVFWVPDLIDGKQGLRRLLAILLVCNGLNAVVGILQVYDPDRWLPREFSQASTEATGVLGYVGPDGRQIIRPPGLSDAPGAVCAPGAAAAVLGMLFCADAGLSVPRRAAAFGFAFAGIAAVYLTHVRSSLIVLAGSLAAYLVVLTVQREWRRAAVVFGLSAGLVAGGLVFAIGLGGGAVSQRFASLFEDDVKTVYYRSGRGSQLELAFRVYLEQFPVGAGLGRWGMMRRYFGDESNDESPMIWAEVQFPAWILDGGVVLLAVYVGALLAALWHDWRLARHAHDPGVRSLAAGVLAANVGPLIAAFSFVPFLAPMGMQYWLLAGALRGVAARAGRGEGGERP